MLKGLHILLVLISFFFPFFIFFNDRLNKNYLKIYWTSFRHFLPNESVFGADDRSGPLFQYLNGRCMATNLV